MNREVQKAKTAALQSAYKLKDYQAKIAKQNKRLTFICDLILGTTSLIDRYDLYVRPLFDSLAILDRLRESLTSGLLRLVEERDAILYRYNELLARIDEMTGKGEFEQFICRKYLSDIWHKNEDDYVDFESQMKGLEN